MFFFFGKCPGIWLPHNRKNYMELPLFYNMSNKVYDTVLPKYNIYIPHTYYLLHL